MNKQLSAVSAVFVLAACSAQHGDSLTLGQAENALKKAPVDPSDPSDPSDPGVDPGPKPSPPQAIIIHHPALPYMQQPSCDPRHVVGLSPSNKFPQPCPAAGGGWVGGNHFDSSSGVKLGNHNFCSYTLPADVPFSLAGLPNLAAVENGPNVSPTEWAQADCPAVTTLGGDGGDEALQVALPEFINSYRAGIGRQARLPILAGNSAPFPVEVAILDSLDDEGTPPDLDHPQRLEHGRAVRAVIEDVTCPDRGNPSSACSVTTRAYSVFDLKDGGEEWLKHERDHSNTDVYRRKSPAGYLLNLARRIDDAVNSANQRGVQNLIINMSVGYAPRFSGMGGEIWNWNLATQTVEAAIRRAACQGVLVIAAIGNREDGPGAWSEAFLPGYMQRESTLNCPTGVADRPMMYSAGGLNPGALPVGNAIDVMYTNGQKMETPFAAPGFAVGAPSGDGSALPLLTGSSFGAAGVSAVAALVWSYLPGLTPQQVMELVHDAASPTGRVAAVTPAVNSALWPGVNSGSPLAQVKSVNACSALASVMNRLCTHGNPSACSQVPQCATLSTHHAVTDTRAATAQALLDLVPVQNRLDKTYYQVQALTIPTSCNLGSTPNVRATTPDLWSQDYCPWKKVNVLGASWSPSSTPAQPIPLYTEPPSSPCRPCIIAKSEPPPDDPTDSSLKKRALVTLAPKYLVISLDPTYRGQLSAATLRIGTKTLALGSDWIDAAMDGVVSISLPNDFEDAASVLSFDKVDDQTSVTDYIPLL